MLRTVAALALAGGLLLTGPGPAAASHPYPPNATDWSRTSERTGTPYPARPSSCTTNRPDTPLWHGTRAIQRLLNAERDRIAASSPAARRWVARAGWPVLRGTGNYCQLTTAAVRAVQRWHGLPGRGAVGFRTAQTLIAGPVRTAAAAAGVRPLIVTCLIRHESNRDPAAVGPDGNDIGLGQIRLGSVNPGVSHAEAWDPFFSIRYVADRLAEYQEALDSEELAVLAHNDPEAAIRVAEGGELTEEEAAYIRSVYAC